MTTPMVMCSTVRSTASPREEVEEVFQNATDADISRSSGRPVVFGDTSTGRHLMVVYEEIDADTVYPLSAYDVPKRQRP